MPESLVHMRLVDSLSHWVSEALFRGDKGAIMVDSPGAGPHGRPPRVLGYVPDLYAEGARRFQVVVGEAKTPRDLDHPRTFEQLSAFLRYAAHYESSLIVVAVPWYVERFAKALLQRLVQQNALDRVSTHVLEKLPG